MTVPIALAGVWVAAGFAAIVLIVRALRRPTTDTDDYCARVDRELDARPTLIGSPLDTNDFDSDVAAIAEEMCEDIQAWLHARRVWEEGAA